jgi:hemerythrin-like domain-containing protein
MNVFEVLKRDHQVARDLFAQMERVEKRERAPVFEQLRHELIAHAQAERAAFYPKLEDMRSTRHDVEEGLEEHRMVEDLLTEMAALDPASDHFMQEAHKLRDCVEHHILDEETKMFLHARQVLPDDRLDEIGDAVKQAKDREGG